MDAQVGQVEGHRIRQDACPKMLAAEPLVASAVRLNSKRDVALQMW